jgi:pyrophosphatase PpaX
MRFPVVLFDFDGTIVDSAAMIRASFRHVHETVLGRELDEARLPEIYRLGPLEAQMRAIDPDRADELTHAYREVNASLHACLRLFPGIAAFSRRSVLKAGASGS